MWLSVLFDHAQTVKQTQKTVAPKKLHINKVMNTQLCINALMNSTLKMANVKKVMPLGDYLSNMIPRDIQIDNSSDKPLPKYFW